MPADRLSELQRQRTLVQQQLAWIDSEIAKESAQQPLTAANVSASPGDAPGIPAVPPSSAMAPSPSVAIEQAPPSASIPKPDDADAIIARYHRSADTSVETIKRGCIIQFIIAMLALGAVVGLTILAYSLLR